MNVRATANGLTEIYVGVCSHDAGDVVLLELGDDHHADGFCFLRQKCVQSVDAHPHSEALLRLLADRGELAPPTGPNDLPGILEELLRLGVPALLQPMHDRWGPLVGVVREVTVRAGRSTVVVDDISLDGRVEGTVSKRQSDVALVRWGDRYLATLARMRSLLARELVRVNLRVGSRQDRHEGFVVSSTPDALLLAHVREDLVDDGRMVISPRFVRRRKPFPVAATWLRSLEGGDEPAAGGPSTLTDALAWAASHGQLVWLETEDHPAVGFVGVPEPPRRGRVKLRAVDALGRACGTRSFLLGRLVLVAWGTSYLASVRELGEPYSP